MNFKKNLNPFLLGVGVLGLFSYCLYDNNRNRFAFQSDDSGNRAGTAANAPLMSKLEWTWYDLKLHFIDKLHTRGIEHASGVLVAKIDDASLERFGRWPWNRSIYAEILSYLYDMGAEVVAFDAVFTEPEFQERYLKEYFLFKGAGHPESLQEKLKIDNAQLDNLSKDLPGIGDQIFASSVLRYPKTVLGYIWQGHESCPLYDPATPSAKNADGSVLTREQATTQGLVHVDELVDSLSGLSSRGMTSPNAPSFEGRGETSVFLGYCPTVNRGNLSANAKYQGFFNAASDSDGLFRRSLLVFGLNSSFVPKGNRDFLPPEWFKNATFFPSLAVEAVSAFWDSPARTVKIEKDGNGHYGIQGLTIDRKEGAPVQIPTWPDGTSEINFYGTQNVGDKPIGEFSLASIQSELSNPKFQDRYGLDHVRPLSKQIVFIGPTALGVYDLRPNPVQGDAAGVFLHATMAARMLEYGRNAASHVVVSFAGLKTNMVILWGLGLALILSVLSLQSLPGVLTAIGIGLAFIGADFWVFSSHAVALDVMTVVNGLASSFLAIFVWKYFTEERDRAFVKGAFEKYVSPDLVGQILQDPKKLNLGGQKKILTVMFSDIRGFTTISEKMGAAELAKFLNEYLSPMTDIIQANKGTIDKYMGDAIMSIFGAPIEYNDHAPKAVEAGLAMMTRLEELQKEWAARQLPRIEIGIGINTGEMSVGNMGSSRIFSYTVMGDSVNLGSRLEGINKEYGTNLIVSESTRKELGPEFLCRELDRVKVKGKKLPVTIFEVMAKGAPEDKKSTAARFEEGLQLYYAKRFSEARRVFDAQAATDKTSAIYVQRCELWLEHPPEDDWDGSWTMKTK